jgi:hypothetical protein
MGSTSGVETPVTPDGPDVVDAGPGKYLARAKHYQKFRESAFLEWERAVA